MLPLPDPGISCDPAIIGKSSPDVSRPNSILSRSPSDIRCGLSSSLPAAIACSTKFRIGEFAEFRTGELAEFRTGEFAGRGLDASTPPEIANVFDETEPEPDAEVLPEADADVNFVNDEGCRRIRSRNSSNEGCFDSAPECSEKFAKIFDGR